MQTESTVHRTHLPLRPLVNAYKGHRNDAGHLGNFLKIFKNAVQ